MLHNLPTTASIKMPELLYPYFRMTFEAEAANWIKAGTEEGGRASHHTIQLPPSHHAYRDRPMSWYVVL